MDFKKDKYLIIKNIISKDLAQFLYNYLIIKRQVYHTMTEFRYLSPFDESYGNMNDPQLSNTWSCYGDTAMDTVLLRCQEKIEKETKLKLIPTYSYTRLYKKGDVLERHKDRFSCEVSTTLYLGGSTWPIYVDTNPKTGIFIGKKDEDGRSTYIPGKTKGKKIDLDQGDLLVYYGCDLEHWREPLKKKECAQVFFHFNTPKSKHKNLFDGRPHVGLPDWFRNRMK